MSNGYKVRKPPDDDQDDVEGFALADTTRSTQFLDLLTKAQSPSSREHASVVSHLRGHLSRCAKQPRRAPEPKPYSGPLPNTTPLLTRVSHNPPAYASTVRPRPQSQLKGTRHVPILSCSAEKIPFLRIRKPISAFLSRVIRQRGRKRNVRSSMLTEIEEEHEPFAAQEDLWERQVRRLLAEAKRPYPAEAEDPPYSDSLWAAHDSIVDWLHADARDLVARSDAMLQIVEDEQALAQRERDERRRASKQRWTEKQKTRERNPQGTGKPKT